MIRHIPSKETRRWTGPYLGNYYGNLWKTFNVDLDRNEGKIGLSYKMQQVEDSSEMIGGDAVRAFLRCNADCTDRYWGLTNAELLKTDSTSPENFATPDNDWDPDALDSTPSDPLDFTVHGNDSRADSGRNKLFVTRDTGDIAVLNDTGDQKWTKSWWITKQSQPALNVNVPFHPIEYFPNRKISLVGDGNLVHTISRPSDTQNDTVTYARLVLPYGYVINHIFATSSRAWILCYHRFDGQGAIVEWDGFSQTYNNLYNAYGISALTGINYQDIPIVLNSKGVFLEYTGQSFAPMMRNGQRIAFPVAEELGNALADSSDTRYSPHVSPRGMCTDANGLVYINARYPNFYSWRHSGGIWCLNPDNGRLYNKYSMGKTGDSADYGQQSLISTGAVYSIPSRELSQEMFVAGGLVLGTNLGTETGIWVGGNPNSAPTVNKGYFVTQYVPADEVREFWDALWVRFKEFRTSGSALVVKARGTRPLVNQLGKPQVQQIAWASASTFTVTLSGSDDALAKGDEVELFAGTNAGQLAHITDISGAHGALQTITIDEVFATGSGSSYALFDRWKKLGEFTRTSGYEASFPIGIDSSFVQFKIELRGPSPEVEVSDLLFSSKTSIYAQK